MMAMVVDVNESLKGEDPSVPRGCDRKEEKEPFLMTVEWGGGGGVGGRTIVSSSVAGQGLMHKVETN